MNAILREITPNTKANEIRLERSTHKGSFLLVEGETDVRLFARLVDNSCCRVTLCHGREFALEVVTILEGHEFTGFLAVIDDDFAKALGEVNFSDNVCITDLNDMECLIFMTGAWEKFLSEYGSPAKIASVEAQEGKSVRDLIIEQAAFLGAIRLCAKKHCWPLRFQDMKYRFSNNRDVRIDHTRTAGHLLGRSRGITGINREMLIEIVYSELESHSDYMSLCSGHDLCRIIARSLRRLIGTHSSFENDVWSVGRVLRLAFEWSHFQTTELFRCMRRWEARNSPYRIFQTE